jgi:hypothetical protein
MAEAVETVPMVASPDGQALPFVFNKPHRVKGAMVPEPMLYPSREMIEASMRAVPVGASSSLVVMRLELAKAHRTASTCPMTTQRLVREIADASFDAWQSGRKTGIAPFWRVIDPDRPSARQFPGGAAFIRERREEEERG